MTVPMMGVRIVGVIVRQGLVPVRVIVYLGSIPRAEMAMLVVGVMGVRMRMF